MIDERVPHTYCWSPSLVPKPSDWPYYIDVSGFFFLDLATNYKPSEDLVRFLEAGNPPIYIGFGSITGHDPRKILRIVLEALVASGYRALISGLAKEDDVLPENVFRIGNCPHDWLFQHGKISDFYNVKIIDVFFPSGCCLPSRWCRYHSCWHSSWKTNDYCSLLR
jgi:UDP:flavonoid glycosyltransferase YjiC (YdhE family)